MFFVVFHGSFGLQFAIDVVFLCMEASWHLSVVLITKAV